jgi:hypothetical protein
MGRALWRSLVPSYKVFMGEDRTFVVAKRGRVIDEHITQLEFSRPVKVTFIRRTAPKDFLTKDGKWKYRVHAWCDVLVR